MIKLLIEGSNPAVTVPNIKRRAPNCQGALTKAWGINTNPATINAANNTLCGPTRSEIFPNLGAEIILASPDAAKTAPAISAI